MANRMTPESDAALIVVDVQNDFCPGGALGVDDGDGVVPVLNEWIEAFRAAGRPVIYTQDWHPEGHVSFTEEGGIWPVHCVQDTEGAAFHDDLIVDGYVFQKAFQKELEGYSGFDGRLVEDGTHGPELAEWLQAQGVRKVYVGGLTTDYCVRATVLDARENGLDAVFLADASRPVNVKEGDEERAVADMQAAGAALK